MSEQRGCSDGSCCHHLHCGAETRAGRWGPTKRTNKMPSEDKDANADAHIPGPPRSACVILNWSVPSAQSPLSVPGKHLPSSASHLPRWLPGSHKTAPGTAVAPGPSHLWRETASGANLLSSPSKSPIRPQNQPEPPSLPENMGASAGKPCKQEEAAAAGAPGKDRGSKERLGGISGDALWLGGAGGSSSHSRGAEASCGESRWRSC